MQPRKLYGNVYREVTYLFYTNIFVDSYLYGRYNAINISLNSFTDYIFDGHENDNLRWMNNDIAVVKVEEEFDFTRKIRGCDFIPRPIGYNNQSSKYEDPGNLGWIAGWGSTEKYSSVSKSAQTSNA